jgi:hypothetical protein
MVWHSTQCMDWNCGWFGKVPHERIGMVDGLERCLEYGWFYGKSYSNQLRTDSREWTPQDNRCYYVSSMEQLAD